MILMYLCFCNNYGGLGLCNNYGGLMAKTIIIVVIIVVVIV